MIETKTENRHLLIIGVLSVVVPLLVAILIFMPAKLDLGSDWVLFLPHLNATLNSATTVALLLGLYFIKKKQIKYHRTAMFVAFALGAIFLISYVIYHASAPSTIFGDTNRDGILDEAERAVLGTSRSVYLVVLLSHIILATIVVPFVLLAIYYAVNDKIQSHRKIVKWTFPIWLYVSITGVVVYFMISAYY